MMDQLHFTAMSYAVTTCDASVMHLGMRSCTYHGTGFKKKCLGKKSEVYTSKQRNSFL